jgi:hypothetical protein
MFPEIKQLKKGPPFYVLPSARLHNLAIRIAGPGSNPVRDNHKAFDRWLNGSQPGKFVGSIPAGCIECLYRTQAHVTVSIEFSSPCRIRSSVDEAINAGAPTRLFSISSSAQPKSGWSFSTIPYSAQQVDGVSAL